MKFLIPEKKRESILIWLEENLGNKWPRPYQWFPFYRTAENEPAFMVVVYAEEDCTAFTLKYNEYICYRVA